MFSFMNILRVMLAKLVAFLCAFLSVFMAGPALPSDLPETPEDFVIATGVQHTVRDFTEKAFAANGMTIRWEGTDIDEKGYDAETGKMLVCVNPQWFRPTDVDNLWGDPTKAKTVLGWNPQTTTYEELIRIMAEHDRKLAIRERTLKEAGER